MTTHRVDLAVDDGDRKTFTRDQHRRPGRPGVLCPKTKAPPWMAGLYISTVASGRERARRGSAGAIDATDRVQPVADDSRREREPRDSHRSLCSPKLRQASDSDRVALLLNVPMALNVRVCPTLSVSGFGCTATDVSAAKLAFSEIVVALRCRA